MRLRLGDFAGQEGIGAGGNGRLEIALRTAGAQADAPAAGAGARHQRDRAAQRACSMCCRQVRCAGLLDARP
jgi:hypothetical protein